MLEMIHSPKDLRALSVQETERLAAEIRQSLIDSVAMTGGHLASNLGAVELTLAIHRVFDTPSDKVFFDVGHQSYTHKLVTGRQEMFKKLRTEGGISGFPKRSESEYDVFETGHASTALSGALGMARARDARGEDYDIVALVGDGALTGGMCYEALNDAGSRPTQLVMLLNDNEMSIAHNVGALSAYLTKLRGSEHWLETKSVVKRGLHRIPLVGAPLAGVMERIKRTMRLMLIPGEFFEALGFGYLGPIDGHDIRTLERALRDAKAMKRPVVVHAVTQKGKGYELAERKPEMFHGVAPFIVETGESRSGKTQGELVSAASVAGDTLLSIAWEDKRVMAITAAMAQGTGLSAFATAHPDRFFDVGIAEEHAMTLAAGMAAGGMRPVFAVYASFLQRACDQLLHDICLQSLPVTVLLDHAGFVSGDGATHQGVYDLPMLRAMPGLTIWSPCDARELDAMLRAAVKLDGPCVIRYPKSLPKALGEPDPAFAWREILPGGDIGLVGHGHSLEMALEAAELLREQGLSAGVYGATVLHEMDAQAMSRLQAADLVAVVEEGTVQGGLGEAMLAYYTRRGLQAPRMLLLGIDGVKPGAHSLDGLARECGLDAACVAARIREALHGG